MSSDQSPVSGGQSAKARVGVLGPHVVGQRVVVRHLLPGEVGPSGGPALNDVLGVCLSWADGACVLQLEDGSTRTVSTRLIVSGKPVPPRASVRDRVSARAAESHGLVLWPGVQTLPLGDWLLRIDPTPQERLFKRANSCLAMGTPAGDLVEAEAEVRRFYSLAGRQPLVQLEPETAVEEHFRSSGWQEASQTHFLITAVSVLHRRLPRPVADLVHHEDGPRVLVELHRDGALLARGRAALHDDWLGLHSVATHPRHRRQGLAQLVLASLVDWGASQGAATAWLHVETDNAPAIALYEGLGFRQHHRTTYFTPPQSPR